MFRVVTHYKTRDITKNQPLDEAMENLVERWLPT